MPGELLSVRHGAARSSRRPPRHHGNVHEDCPQQELHRVARVGRRRHRQYTRLHWTDQPYKWHVNDGEEVFVVLDGRVEMRYRDAGVERSAVLEAGDIFFASVGTEHVACLLGEARILVVETEGSV